MDNVEDKEEEEVQSVEDLPEGEVFGASYIWKFSNNVEINTHCQFQKDEDLSTQWIVFELVDIGIHGLGEPIEEYIELFEYDDLRVDRYDENGKENFNVCSFMY